MQINYDILSTLNEKSLEQGLFAIYNNALELNISADILAKEEKYAMATALKLLSVEELIKAQFVFLFIIGVTSKDFIDLGFKKIKDHKTVHQTRLVVAAIFNGINNIINKVNIEEKFTSIIDANPEKFELLKEERPEDFIKRVVASVPSVNEILNDEGILTDGRLDKVIEKKDDWLASAQTIKEKCMYVDIEGGRWTSPIDIKINEYLEADKNAKEVFTVMAPIIEDLMTNTKEGRRLTFLSLKTIMKQIYPDIQAK
jgi:AbiV family abortive infection protein